MVATRPIARGEQFNCADMNSGNLEKLMRTGSFTTHMTPLNNVLLDIELDEEDPMFKIKLELLEKPVKKNPQLLKGPMTNA